jgi:hypothetical protein
MVLFALPGHKLLGVKELSISPRFSGEINDLDIVPMANQLQSCRLCWDGTAKVT